MKEISCGALLDHVRFFAVLSGAPPISSTGPLSRSPGDHDARIASPIPPSPFRQQILELARVGQSPRGPADFFANRQQLHPDPGYLLFYQTALCCEGGNSLDLLSVLERVETQRASLSDPIRRSSFLASILPNVPAITRRLVLIPDGALHVVPISVLPLPEAFPGYRPLLERFEVVMAPSASSLGRGAIDMGGSERPAR